MNKENLFREIFSLYSLINKQIDEYTSVNKNNINEIKEAQKTLRGLYNQYDCVKTNIYPIIVTGLKNNIPKYSQMLEKENKEGAEKIGTSEKLIRICAQTQKYIKENLEDILTVIRQKNAEKTEKEDKENGQER